jgi:hypothetical protein
LELKPPLKIITYSDIIVDMVAKEIERIKSAREKYELAKQAVSRLEAPLVIMAAVRRIIVDDGWFICRVTSGTDCQ